MNRALVFGSFGLAVLATAMALYLHRENAALRRELAALRSTRPEVTSNEGLEASTARDRLSAAKNSEVADASSAGNGSPSARSSIPVASPETPRPRFSRRDRGSEFLAETLTDPAGRAAMLTRLKGQIDRSFGEYFVELGLNPTQIEALRTLLAERQLVRMEARMLERNAANEEERAQAAGWRDGKLATTETDINAILGPDGLNNLQAHLDAAPQRAVAEDVARRASYAGAEMSDEARDRLVEVIQRATTEQPLPELWSRGWRGRNDEAAAREPMTNDRAQAYLRELEAQQRRVLEEARAFLTRPQLEALVDQQLDARQQAEARLKFLRREHEDD